MKNNVLFVLVSNLASIACIVGAVLLALNGIEGWGWFLAGALVLSESFNLINIQGDKK